jgi:peptide-methionine (S)-S-oxide reductase
MKSFRSLFSRRVIVNLSLFFVSIVASSGLLYRVLPIVTDITVAAASSPELPNPKLDSSKAKSSGTQTAVLAGGCFWGVEAVFEHLVGVSDVVSGFSGGGSGAASYQEVTTGRTGHAEAVKITYNPAKITYGQLLKVYFSVAHDPTQLNRQGPDRGTQYRSAIFFTNPEQKQVAQSYKDQLSKTGIFKQPIVTQVVPFKAFYAAEKYHQDFIVHNPTYPYVVVHDLPKLKQLKQVFPTLYKRLPSDTF